MKYLVICFIVLLVSTTSYAGDDYWDQVKHGRGYGNDTHRIYEDGESSVRIGNSRFYSDGSYETGVGRSTFDSEGESSHQIGNYHYRSDGNSGYDIGNSHFTEDGYYQRLGDSSFEE